MRSLLSLCTSGHGHCGWMPTHSGELGARDISPRQEEASGSIEGATVATVATEDFLAQFTSTIRIST